jgi:hypothetical protein
MSNLSQESNQNGIPAPQIHSPSPLAPDGLEPIPLQTVMGLCMHP